MSRLDALRAYALVKQPAAQIPPSTLLIHDLQTLAIFDAYPKAKYHFLVLPRYPFYQHSDESHTFGSVCKLDALDDLKSLMLKPGDEAREEIFLAMKNMAREVEEMIKDEMMKTEGFAWGVDVGFHAIPSMKWVSGLAMGGLRDETD
jgi:aprataxin